MSGADLGYFASKKAFNASQGYRIDYKYLGLAYGIEIAVVLTSLLSAWFFAEIYGHHDATTMAMMMLAPIAYAGIEIARVPLALALRTQPNWFWKIIFAVMVLCAVAVSVKSLSQLGEVMFRPRLIDVTKATAALKDAQNAQASYGARIKAADAVVAQRTAELGDAEKRLKAVNTELGALPPDRCARVWHTNRSGKRYSSQDCHADGRQKAMTSNLADAETSRTEASEKLDDARKRRDALDPSAAAKHVSALELARRDAILNSQLHSFTGMFFGKDPTEVSEGELHSFLRFFVFFPAIFASLAATALALASVTPLKKVDEPIELDSVETARYLFEPMAVEITREAVKQAVEAVARERLADGRLEPQAPPIPAQPEAILDQPAVATAVDKPDVGKTSLTEPKVQPSGPMRPTVVPAPDSAAA